MRLLGYRSVLRAMRSKNAAAPLHRRGRQIINRPCFAARVHLGGFFHRWERSKSRQTPPEVHSRPIRVLSPQSRNCSAGLKCIVLTKETRRQTHVDETHQKLEFGEETMR